MNVVVPPVLVGGKILRIVSSAPHLYEVEEWVGEWWEPSSVTLSVATMAPVASREELDARGVPESERTSGAERLSIEHLSERLRAPVNAFEFDISKPPSISTEGMVRRREYAGSAKFRRPRAPNKKKLSEKRRAAGTDESSSQEWTGPFRRATDVGRDTPPSTP
jgi:hypothetical protein